MLHDDMFVGGQFTWFIGEIKDINDPLKNNRVKVLPFGYYDIKVETRHLPWATVMMPNTSASYKGNGSNHELVVGSWVVGFFRDGNSAQDPIIMGSFASKTDGVNDLPTETTANYPDNKVHKTEAGHVIEYDNTAGSERIEITHKDNHTLKMTGPEVEIRHKSGTVINIAENGTISIDASNDIVNIDGNTTITGTLHVTGAQTNDSTIVASGTITDSGATLASHTHTDSSGLGAGTTSPPN